MPNTTHPPTRLRSLLPWAIGLCLLGSAQAQQAPNPGSATSQPADDDTMVLSPFEVNSSQDVGYLAGNTLSGSRLNTRLKDTAASISVMTEEFMRDVGAYDISEALVYANNLQLDMDDAGTFGDSPGGNPTIELPQTYRVRGLPATVSRNYFKWVNPTDTYNIERLEDSRGPNSILFGIGSAGGVINVSTKQPHLYKTFTKVEAGTGSHGSWRGTLDYNQVLLKDKLGIRFNAVWNHTNSYRYYGFNEAKQADLSIKYQVTPTTTVRAEYEKGRQNQNVPRTYTLFDFSLPWINAGMPTFSSTAPTSTISPYGSRLGSNQFRYISNTQQLISVTGQILTTGENRPILDESIANHRVNFGGPAQDRHNDFDAITAFVTQKLGQHSYIEAAFNHQAYDWHSYDPATSFRLYGDANQTLPGTLGANPYAGRLFLETNWRLYHRKESSDTGRLTFATEWDAKKWGHYRFAALGELENRTYERYNFMEAWDNHPFNSQPEASANAVTRRTYVTTGDWASYYVDGPTVSGFLTGVTDPVTGRTLTSKWVPVANQDNDPQKQKGVMLGLQASEFKGRLILAGGYRRDFVDIFDRNRKRDPITNEYEVDYDNVDEIKAQGDTKTLGAVWHVTDQFSLLYNKANNRALPNSMIRILPNQTISDGSTGEGSDYGFSLDLFNGKVFAKAVRFTTKSRGEQVGKNGTDDFRNTNLVVLDSLLKAGLITQAAHDEHDIPLVNGWTTNKDTEGYEFQLTANPTRNLRLMVNYSYTDGVESDVGLEVRKWWATEGAYLKSFPQTTPSTSGTKDIGTEISEWEDVLANAISLDGIGLVGNRKHKANFFAHYSFTNGFLKGFGVGGGYRYQGKMLAGRTKDGSVVQYAPPVGEASAAVDWGMTFKNKQRLTLRLNIQNLFNETDPIITRYAGSGDITRVTRVILREPISWRLTADYSF